MKPPHWIGPWLGCALLAIVTLGCDKGKKPRLDVHPVSGRVTVDGKPAGAADIYFYADPQIAGLAAVLVTRTEPDGTFQAGTYEEHDGLPAGQYNVTVLWPTRTIVEGEEVTGDDQLRGRFSKPQQPVAKVTVAEAPLEIPPIQLKTR